MRSILGHKGEDRHVTLRTVLYVVLLLAVTVSLACGGGGRRNSPTAPIPPAPPPPPDTTDVTGGDSLQLQTKTNGSDADTAPGPTITTGKKVTWAYRIDNTGSTTLSSIALTDDVLGSINCPADSLLGGESMVCKVTGVAQTGQYSNMATVTATAENAATETATDPSHYFGKDAPPPQQGCESGFWKTNADNDGADAWPAGYTPSTSLAAAGFVNAVGVAMSATMRDALAFSGGPDLEDWERNMLKPAVAALLNAASNNVNYQWGVTRVLDEVNAALATDDKGTMSALKGELASMNQEGCPLL